MLGFLDYDPEDVRTDVKLAYSVRSRYVHGSQLSPKSKERLQDKYGGLKDFLLKLLDYLRVAIICAIRTDMEKEDFLKLVDDSLISEQAGIRLGEALKDTRALLR